MNNIRCEVIRDLLPLYADHAVSQVTQKEIQDHLEGCSECRRLYELTAKELKVPLLEEDIHREEEGIRSVQKKLKKKNRKTILVMLAVFAGILLSVYVFGIRGLAASSDVIRYEFSINETDEAATLVIEFFDINRKSIVIKADMPENGECTVILREVPLFDDGGDHGSYGITMTRDEIEDSSADRTIQIVFRDKTETLSWKELYNNPEVSRFR